MLKPQSHTQHIKRTLNFELPPFTYFSCQLQDEILAQFFIAYAIGEKYLTAVKSGATPVTKTVISIIFL